MADIELVIKLDEDRYKSICDGVEAGKRVNVPSLYAHKIIANGTPLPKGHGKLKDENEIKQMIEGAKVESEYSKNFAENIIKFASTIIEADSR